jgi:hypothetical protein
MKMREVKLTKEQEILFEVYNKGVQNEDCNLDNYLKKLKKALTAPVDGNSFICVKDQEPPKSTELIVQDPKGVTYLTSWRESYSVFMCQSKEEDSSNWKWKQI